MKTRYNHPLPDNNTPDRQKFKFIISFLDHPRFETVIHSISGVDFITLTRERISRNPVTRVTEYPRTRKIPASFVFQNRICFTSVMFVSCSRRYFDRHLEITFLNPACEDSLKNHDTEEIINLKIEEIAPIIIAFYRHQQPLAVWFWLDGWLKNPAAFL